MGGAATRLRRRQKEALPWEEAGSKLSCRRRPEQGKEGGRRGRARGGRRHQGGSPVELGWTKASLSWMIPGWDMRRRMQSSLRTRLM